MTDLEAIQAFVERSIDRFRSAEIDLFYLDSSILPNEMIDESKPIVDGLHAWKPIPSIVTDADMAQLEQQIGYGYPPSYKTFLQYKHFCELPPLSSVWFFEFPSSRWKTVLVENIFNNWSRSYTLDKGLIPFAKYEDWGLTCFDTNTKDSQGEYAICYWDHDQPDYYSHLAESFPEMIKEILKDRKENAL